MQADRFDVYDIDGTLTFPGHDLWHLCTRSLSGDKDPFDKYVAAELIAEEIQPARVKLVTWSDLRSHVT